MKERAVFQDFNSLWAQHVAASTSPRMTDDQEERDFWQRFMARKIGYAPDPSSRAVAAALLERMAGLGVETALELGPGWGNSTIDLARACRQVDCVDISQDVLDFILRIGEEQGCRNITVHHRKWEEFQAERPYDLVFGYNCFYRQADLRACFERMDRCAGKLCVAGMNSGVAPQWVREMEEAGAAISWEWKDYIYFVGVLYQMGIDPDVTILPFTKEFSYPDGDALLQGECARLKVEPTDAIREVLLRAFRKEADGSFHAEARYHSALVSWIPGRRL